MVDLLALKYDIKGSMSFNDITVSFSAINYHFNREVRKYPVLKNSDPELGIFSISKQSPLKIELKPLIVQTVISVTIEFVLNQTLTGMQANLQHLLGNAPRPKEGYERGQLQAYRNMFKPLSRQAGNITIEGHENSKIILNMNFNSIEAEEIKRRTREEERNLDLSIIQEFRMVHLKLKTAVDDTNKERVGDKGVISEIALENVRLSFSDLAIKEKILQNPFHQIFLVSVQAEIIDGKPQLYRITELHE